MSYNLALIRDIVLAIILGLVGAVLTFFVTINWLNWHLFRDFPEDATRGITENIDGALAGLTAFPIAAIAALVWRRRRAER